MARRCTTDWRRSSGATRTDHGTPRGRSPWWLVCGPSSALFPRGVGVRACNVHVVSLRQALTPDRPRGRMDASYRPLAYRPLAYGTIPPGTVLGG